MAFECGVCSSKSFDGEYQVREMMFGLRSVFIYHQCSNCKCLQIEKIPEDMGKYYPKDYYSFGSIENERQYPSNFKGKLTKSRDKSVVTGKGILGNILSKVWPNDYLMILQGLGLNENTRVLDIGCGRGRWLMQLKELGLKNLSGIDPFISQGYKDEFITIEKKDVFDLQNETFDFIMLNHSFEHMEKPLEVLQKIRLLLDQEGICMIRIPTVSSFVWEEYRENWVQLDAPRHFFLHSKESVELLAKKSDFEVVNYRYDSSDFQFWGSVQYQEDIPLNSPQSYRSNRKDSIFTEEQINEFKEKAKELNRTQRGDMFAVYLKPI